MALNEFVLSPVDWVNFVSWVGVGAWRRIRAEFPGLRKIWEMEMRFVLESKLPYEAAYSWPVELSGSQRRGRQMAVSWGRVGDLRAPPDKSS